MILEGIFVVLLIAIHIGLAKAFRKFIGFGFDEMDREYAFMDRLPLPLFIHMLIFVLAFAFSLLIVWLIGIFV